MSKKKPTKTTTASRLADFDFVETYDFDAATGENQNLEIDKVKIENEQKQNFFNDLKTSAADFDNQFTDVPSADVRPRSFSRKETKKKISSSTSFNDAAINPSILSKIEVAMNSPRVKKIPTTFYIRTDLGKKVASFMNYFDLGSSDVINLILDCVFYIENNKYLTASDFLIDESKYSASELMELKRKKTKKYKTLNTPNIDKTKLTWADNFSDPNFWKPR